MKVSITTLGCKSNQYDSAALEDALRGASMSIAPFPGPADAYVINTCTVTGKTDIQSRQLIRKIRRENPGAVVIVTGCYAQVSSDEVLSIEGVDYVVGNPAKGQIAEYIMAGRPAVPVKDIGRWQDGTPWSLRARGSAGRTRANIKIQEGCNRSCSYCIIPKARGISRSLSLDEVEREIESLVSTGYREIILTGIHLGAYGADFREPADLCSVITLIERRRWPARFRISSLDPDEVTERLIDLLGAAERVCNHLHLPLQSGDDSVIRRMHRPYTASFFAEKVETLASRVPGISIGADVIAGFPGEGEKEFENTFSLVSALPLSYLHVFPYSVRHGTPAAGFTGQVPSGAIRERCARLHALDAQKRDTFNRTFIGTDAEVLVEAVRDRKTGLMKGRSKNYIQVFLEGDDSMRRTLAAVRLTALFGGGMSAEIQPARKQEAS